MYLFMLFVLAPDTGAMITLISQDSLSFLSPLHYSSPPHLSCQRLPPSAPSTWTKSSQKGYALLS